MKKIIVIAIMLMIFQQLVICETLTVSYLERPPYYETITGKPTGFLIELTMKIFKNAKIKVNFKDMPPKRIMMEIKRDGSLHCSVGWFKNKDRIKFAKFSLPIYQNKRIVILTTIKKSNSFSGLYTLRQVFQDKSLAVVTMSAFSYGNYIDKLIKDTSPNLYKISSEQNTLPKMIMKNRASYMLIAPEEVDRLIESAGFKRKLFTSINLTDIPAGNKRYLIFNKYVSNKMIKKINISIRKLVHIR